MNQFWTWKQQRHSTSHRHHRHHPRGARSASRPPRSRTWSTWRWCVRVRVRVRVVGGLMTPQQAAQNALGLQEYSVALYPAAALL